MSDNSNRFEGRGTDVGFGSATGIPGSTLTGQSGQTPTGYDRERDEDFGDETGGATRAEDLGDNYDGLGRDRTDDVTADETGTLIAGSKVMGTAVYNADGERLGSIDDVVLNKRSGRVAYAVLSAGGFLGIGERFHPLPWDELTYDEEMGGYNIDLSSDDLRDAPNYSRSELDTLDYSGSGINDYYGGEAAGAMPSRGIV